jgi:hypothetical protein
MRMCNIFFYFSLIFRLIYLIQFSYYIQLLINLIFIVYFIIKIKDEKLDDFYEMLIHHVLTIFLVLNSYSSFNHRTGLYILFLHDFVDIFLYVGKSFYGITKFIIYY